MAESLWSRAAGRWRRHGAEPSRFGDYDLVRVLHDGKKSFVYQVRSGDDGPSYALKVYKPLYNRTARRICKRYGIPREGEAGFLLNPPAGRSPQDYPIVRTIAQGWEYGDPTRCYFVVQEFVDGFNLKHLIHSEHSLFHGRRLHIVQTLGRALDLIHKKGFVHRDVCTENILLFRDGRPKLVDLGFMVPPGMRFPEKTGTPSYMSPEQFLVEPLHPTSDVYSYGVVLFEIFAGRLPFTTRLRSDNPELMMRRMSELMEKHVKAAPPRPSDVNPKIRTGLDRVILKCLEKSPDRRYQSIKAVLAGLSRLKWPAKEKSAGP